MDTAVIFAVAVLSFAASALLGKTIIPTLKRLHVGQTISEYVKEHKSKQNTPTMGGVMFIVPVTLFTAAGATALFFSGNRNSTTVLALLISLLMCLCLTAVGFVDDYIKVVKKRNEGLNRIEKTLLQSLVIIAYIVSMRLTGNLQTALWVPFTEWTFDIGFFTYPLLFIGIYCFINAVNFTDGIDGLCACVTLVTCLFFIPVTAMLGLIDFSCLASAMAGGLLGFLVWNFHPAKVFMGDTGSMFCGAIFVSLAFAIKMPLVMIPIGFIFVIEFLSDIIQITAVKLTHGKRRVFRKAPIHHHYQLGGWSETKIVAVFSIITLLFCIITGIWLYMMFA